MAKRTKTYYISILIAVLLVVGLVIFSSNTFKVNLTKNNYEHLALTEISNSHDAEDSTIGKSGEIPSEDFKNAQWLTYDRQLPKKDSLFYLDRPSPIFRKVFESKGEVSEAKLYITSAGYYKGTINGKAIGKNILDPAWTDYSKRIYYTEYDITDQIEGGTNCLGVSLGNGFYDPLPLRKWGRRNPRKDLSVGKPAFIAKLLVRYTNGRTDTINTDKTWKFNYGPILKNSVYLGTVYDANKQITNWNLPSFDDTSWHNSQVIKGPGGVLQKAFFPPVQITKTISPVAITQPKNGTYIVDMGENFTGTYKIRLSGKVGDSINFRFGERLYDDGTLNPMTTVIGQIKKKGMGGPGAPDIAWQTDSYIIGTESPTWFEPEFTYHVYRYMEIKGLESSPDVSDIEGLLFHTNVTDVGQFNSSSELLNKIEKIVEQSFLTNLISVQSDCAAREKFGYGGDLNATSESYIYNYDMQDFYRKTVYDWIDAMKDSTFVDTAPFAGIQYCGISWESAYLITQYQMYLYYGDTEFVKELYSTNLKWMEKVARIHPNGLVENGLSDHESLEPVPVELTGTAHYLQCAEIMETFAKVMNDDANKAKFAKLTERLRTIIKSRFWDQAVTEKINRQTLFSTLLYHNIVPADGLEAAKDSLKKAINKEPAGHFNTGIFGTKYILETASEHISPSFVFNIVNSKTFPGWGFMVDHGATTLWETWKESEDVYSNNHPMFGSISEWYYRWLGGIRPDPNHPGFKRFILAPSVSNSLDYVNSGYESPYGNIVSNWRRQGSGAYHYEITVPKNSTANVTLEKTSSQKIQISKNGKSLENSAIENIESGNFELGEGNYAIIVSTL